MSRAAAPDAEAQAPGRGAPTPRTAALLAAAVAVLVFLPAVWGGMVYDDHRFHGGNPALGRLDVLWRAFADPAAQTADGTHAGLYRPLRTLSFALDRALFGQAAFGPHLVNVLLHGAATGLLGGLAARWAQGADREGRRWRPPEEAGPGRALAGWGVLAAALLYALHPAQVEAVAWISSRGDLLSALLLFAALLLDLRGRIGWAALAGAGALLSKEQAVVWPALAAVSGLAAGRRPAAALRHAIVPAAVTIAFVVVRQVLLREPFQEGGLGGSVGVPEIAGMLGHQAWYAALPVGTLFDWQMPWGRPPVLVSLVAAASAAGLLLRLTRPACAWFLAALAPTLFAQLVVPLNILVADRFLVAALPALALLCVRSAARNACVLVPAGVGVLAFAALTLAEIPHWRSEERLWTEVARREPGHWRANVWLGARALARGAGEEALPRLRAAAEAAPADAPTRFHLAQALERVGKNRRDAELVAEALAEYGTALVLFEGPRAEGRAYLAPTARLAVADLSLVLGDLDAARDRFRALVESPRAEVPAAFRSPWDERVELAATRIAEHLRDPGLAQAVREWGASR